MSNVTTTKSKATIDARQLAVTAMLSAVAFILMYVEFAVPVVPSFIKFDFSDLPALIGAFALGPVYGVIIQLIKNLVHLAVSQSMFIGELSNFILGATFAFCAGTIYKRHKTKKTAFVGGIIAAFVMGAVSIVTNYFIVYPIYVKVFFGGDVSICVGMYDAISSGLLHLGHMNTLMDCLVWFNLPFTVVKGLISVVISMLIYQPLRPLLKAKNN